MPVPEAVACPGDGGSRARAPAAKGCDGTGRNRTAGRRGSGRSDERAGERVADELPLDIHGLGDNLEDSGFVELAEEDVVEEAGDVVVQALIAGDELIGEREARPYWTATTGGWRWYPLIGDGRTDVRGG